MSFVFSPLTLPEPPQFQPNNLAELAKKLGSPGSFPDLKNLENSGIPRSRSMEELLADIQHGEAHPVSRLEWVYCIQTKALWDKEHPHRRMATSEAIWEVAAHNSWLSRLLLWRLALYHSGQVEEVLAPTLAECFPIFVSRTKDTKSLPARIVQALTQEQPGYGVARIACEHLLTPKELLERAELPHWIPVVGMALDCVPFQLSTLKPPNQQHVDWLLRCLDEMSVQQQVSAVNYLLTQVPTKVGGSFPKLVDWLRRYYGPRVTGERWHQLSDQAKRALREWIGAINYSDFANLVDRLLVVLRIEDWEQNQLRRRREFWAKYSNRFERIRILLPQTSVNALDRRVFTADIETLATDGSAPTEVCIFDFGEWFVVEFFRGPGSETRLFRRNAQIEQVLFGCPRLSVKRLRCLGGEVHDHKFLWQFYCQEWLQKKGIYSNPGTPPSRNPTDDQLQDRLRGLVRWELEIKNLEREARDYGHD